MLEQDYNVYITQDSRPNKNGRKKTYWTKVGVAFNHKEKNELNVIITQ